MSNTKTKPTPSKSKKPAAAKPAVDPAPEKAGAGPEAGAQSPAPAPAAKPSAAPPEAPKGKPAKKEKPVSEMTPEERRIHESREVLKHPCPPGHKFFEAPDGYIIVGEADREHVLYRKPDGTQIFINPRR